MYIALTFFIILPHFLNMGAAFSCILSLCCAPGFLDFPDFLRARPEWGLQPSRLGPRRPMRADIQHNQSLTGQGLQVIASCRSPHVS